MSYHPIQILQSLHKSRYEISSYFWHACTGKEYRTVCFLKMPAYCPYKACACMMCSEGIYKCIKYGFFNEKLVLQMYKYDKKISADMNI